MLIPTYVMIVMLASFIAGMDVEQNHVADGVACQMRLEVLELREPTIVGGPADDLPKDIYLGLIEVMEEDNAMCRRAQAARQITMNAASEQIGDVELRKGDEIVGTVIYRDYMFGKSLRDEYHHEAIFRIYKEEATSRKAMQEAYARTPFTYSGMGFIP